MKLSIKNNGKSKFSPEYEFLIDGKPVKGDRLIDITINMPADGVPKAVFTYEIDELDIQDLDAKEIRRTSDISAGRIAAGTISTEGISARTIAANVVTKADVEDLAKQIAEQTADEMRRSLK